MPEPKDWDQTIESYKKTIESIKTARRVIRGIIQSTKEIPTDPIAARKRVEALKEKIAIEHQLKEDQEFLKQYYKNNPRRKRRTIARVIYDRIKKQKT